MREEVVVIESGENKTKFELLATVLEKSKFEKLLMETWKKSGKTKDKFLIVIKPNLAMFFKEKITVTDSEMVEYLVDILHDLGFTNVLLGEAQNTFLKWLHNREIHKIAAAIGYKFTTPKGRKYEIRDLAEDTTDCDFPEEYSISGMKISKIWLQADFRINFAKNKTHEEYLYTLCLKNLLGALPLADKHLHYHSRLKVWDVCLELELQFPTHFNIIDGYTSNHGNVGSQVLNPIDTRTVIAGSNVILVDWVGAAKMGIDPYLSPLNAKALNQVGLPKNYRIIGDITPYKGWKNVHPLISKSFLLLDEAETITRIFWPASFIVDRQQFPWKSIRDRLINACISPFWARTDKYASFLWLIIYVNFFFAYLFFLKTAWRTLFNKKALKRKELPINVDKNKFSKGDYNALPSYIKPLEEIAMAAPQKANTSLVFVNRGALFYGEQEVDFEYENFISRVDICKGVTYMNDLIGGRTIRINFDSEKKCINQLERTVFLPQPNSMVLVGGNDIDVTKIQHIEYGSDYHKIIWKTVYSDNNSAFFDDGAVTFSKHNGRTKITILAYQSFLVPPPLFWLKLDYFPSIQRFVFSRQYNIFFKGAIRNYISAAQGRFEPIGMNWVQHKNQ